MKDRKEKAITFCHRMQLALARPGPRVGVGDVRSKSRARKVLQRAWEPHALGLIGGALASLLACVQCGCVLVTFGHVPDGRRLCRSVVGRFDRDGEWGEKRRSTMSGGSVVLLVVMMR